MDVIDKLRNSYLTDDHNTTIVSSDIHDFDKMMHTILMIVEDRLGFVDCVYLNLTKGSGEFCSAAIIVGMSYERVKVVCTSIKKTAMDTLEMIRIETSRDRVGIQLGHGYHRIPTFCRNELVIIGDTHQIAEYVGIRITVGVILHMEVWFDCHDLYSEII